MEVESLAVAARALRPPAGRDMARLCHATRRCTGGQLHLHEVGRTAAM